MSEDEILRRNEHKKENNQHRMVDFAFLYAGMGHVVVISYDPVTARVFCMLDGGSNGFERDENARKHIATDVEYIAKVNIEDLIVDGHKLI